MEQIGWSDIAHETGMTSPGLVGTTSERHTIQKIRIEQEPDPVFAEFHSFLLAHGGLSLPPANLQLNKLAGQMLPPKQV